MGGALWVLPISVEDYIHKEDGSCSNRNKWWVPPDPPIVLSETEQIKGCLISPNGYFHYYCQILGLFPPFWRKKFHHDIYIFKKSQPNKWIGAEELRERMCISQRPRQKGIVLETETCWGLFKTPTIWTISVPQGWGSFSTVESSMENVSSVSIRIEKFISNLEWFFSYS